MRLKGMRALVVGLGRTGVAAAKFLTARGAFVTVTDARPEEELRTSLEQLSSLSALSFELGKHRDKTFRNSDFILISPGISLQISPIQRAIRAKIPVVSDFELASHFLKDIPLVLITGTNGKTTTTYLAGKMFEEAGYNVFVGGNTGRSILDFFAEKNRPNCVIAEVSSYQLETTRSLTPTAAVMLNVTEDHLERHGSFEEYLRVKSLIFEQKGNFPAIINRDDPGASYISAFLERPLFFYSKSKFLGAGAYAEGNKVLLAEESSSREFVSLENANLKGEHNTENIMAAVLAAVAHGIGVEPIQRAIDNFKGLEHRIEFVRRKHFVSFYNDSKATNIDAMEKSLKSFTPPVILVAGGKDKGTSLEKIEPVIRERVKYLILFGEAKDRFNRELGKNVPTFLLGGLEEAIELAYHLSNSEDVILFSPGCSSYDMFSSFEERGTAFKQKVLSL